MLTGYCWTGLLLLLPRGIVSSVLSAQSSLLLAQQGPGLPNFLQSHTAPLLELGQGGNVGVCL